MEFSERVGRISESATMAVTAEAGRLKRAGVDVVALGAGEPDFPTPDHIKQAAIDAINANFTRYTPAGGIPELREAIVGWHAREFGTEYEPRECIATVGGKHAIFNCLAALVREGDEVLLPGSLLGHVLRRHQLLRRRPGPRRDEGIERVLSDCGGHRGRPERPHEGGDRQFAEQPVGRGGLLCRVRSNPEADGEPGRHAAERRVL